MKTRHKDIVAEKVINVQDPDTARIVQTEVYGKDLNGNDVWILLHIPANVTFEATYAERSEA
jgi:hypothetical protein